MSRGDGPFRVRGGHIWPIDSVDVRPRVRLSSWRAYEVAHPRGEALSRHLVGYVLEHDHGQVSSPIVRVDAVARCCVTRSGRVYELVGEPDYCDDASYAWQSWIHVNGVAHARDVTDELFQRCQGGL